MQQWEFDLPRTRTLTLDINTFAKFTLVSGFVKNSKCVVLARGTWFSSFGCFAPHKKVSGLGGTHRAPIWEIIHFMDGARANKEKESIGFGWDESNSHLEIIHFMDGARAYG